MVSAIINLLAALFRAIPSLRELVGIALEVSQSVNVAEAVKRWKTKNNAVKQALDKVSKDNDN